MNVVYASNSPNFIYLVLVWSSYDILHHGWKNANIISKCLKCTCNHNPAKMRASKLYLNYKLNIALICNNVIKAPNLAETDFKNVSDISLDLHLLCKDCLEPGVFRLSFASSALHNFCDFLTTCFAPLSIPQSPVQSCHSTPIKNELELLTVAYCMPMDVYGLKETTYHIAVVLWTFSCNYTFYTDMVHFHGLAWGPTGRPCLLFLVCKYLSMFPVCIIPASVSRAFTVPVVYFTAE